MAASTSDRFLLWIDAVGGYLVCCGDRVVLGQATPGNEVDVPIQGDLAREHATIRRDAEGYLLEPNGETRVDGRPLRTPTVLRDGALVELGATVKVRFRKPHPLSASAALVPASHHRTRPTTDGVLLLAESCLLGPAASCHVVARRWSQTVMLYRHASGLRCRTSGKLEIDGVACDGEGPLALNSQVFGGDFSLSLERLA
ncbi:MAG: hypothetical protein K8T25_07570 [Planctomycetia bacterium]|nr:hypothetical protein [Planctomycetia bacterium]